MKLSSSARSRSSFSLPPSLEPAWTPRLPMDLRNDSPLIGRYVRVDRFQPEKDILHLWDALGGNDGSINDLLKWWGISPFLQPQDLLQLLCSTEEPSGCCVNIFRILSDESCDDGGRSNGEVAGMACFIATQPDHGSTEVGYVAHGAAMSRSRAATEAHYLLAKHAFETMGYRRYEWKCDSNNEPSAAAAKRYGFTFEGRFRQHRVTYQGANRDTNWYSIIDEEWPRRKLAFESWLDPDNFDQNGRQKTRLEDILATKKTLK